MGGPDRAISRRDEDVLDRWQLAKTVYELIEQTHNSIALRIGIYGRWGEGKTSVMQLVEAQAYKAGIPVCRLQIWSARNQAELWRALVDALDDVLPARDKRVGFKSWVNRLVGRAEGLAAAHKLVSPAIGVVRLFSRATLIGEKDARRLLERLAESPRVVVLVDDLDRVDPVLIPQLLMGLHELFDDLGRCAFVIAVDPYVVSQGLAKRNPGWDSASSFLNKIVQYPFWLPPVPPEQKGRLVANGVRDYGLHVLEAALHDLRVLLPANPRELKQFLRGLQRFKKTLGRHDLDEWSPPLLLLCEIFRHEFPEAAAGLFLDTSFLKNFTSGHWRISEERYEQTNISTAQHERIEQAVRKSREATARATQDMLIQRLVLVADAASHLEIGEEEVRRHTTFDNNPPVITLREFDGMLNVWRGTSERSAIDESIGIHAAQTERSRELILDGMCRALLTRRGQQIDAMRQAFDASSGEVAKTKFNHLSELLFHLIDEHSLLRDARMPERVEIFRLIRNQHTHLVNGLSDPEHAGLRRRDRERIYAAADSVQDLALDVLVDLKPSDRHTIPRSIAGGEEIHEFQQHLLMKFAEWSCNSLVERFTRPDSIAALVSVLGLNAEIWLLFTPESPFHTARWRAKLWDAATGAGEIGAKNMFVFLRMLLGDRGTGGQVPALARDIDLVVPAWKIASTVRPQLAMRAEVVKVARLLGQATGDAEAFLVPTWPDVVDSDTDRDGGHDS